LHIAAKNRLVAANAHRKVEGAQKRIHAAGGQDLRFTARAYDVRRIHKAAIFVNLSSLSLWQTGR